MTKFFCSVFFCMPQWVTPDHGCKTVFHPWATNTIIKEYSMVDIVRSSQNGLKCEWPAMCIIMLKWSIACGLLWFVLLLGLYISCALLINGYNICCDEWRQWGHALLQDLRVIVLLKSAAWNSWCCCVAAFVPRIWFSIALLIITWSLLSVSVLVSWIRIFVRPLWFAKLVGIGLSFGSSLQSVSN